MKRKKKCLLIYRERKFSPGKIQSDQIILTRVGNALECNGWVVKFVSGENFKNISDFTKFKLILTMSQNFELLKKLSQLAYEGIPVINSPKTTIQCFRSNMMSVLSSNKLPVPVYQECNTYSSPQLAFTWPSSGIWIKRTDFHAISPDDVVHILEPELLFTFLKKFKNRGHSSAIIQQHISGNVFKCYSVGKAFFFSCHPAPKSLKQSEQFKQIIIKVSEILKLDIFGVDLVVDSKNRAVVIDVNDWPSFSPCNIEASHAITKYIRSYYNG